MIETFSQFLRALTHGVVEFENDCGADAPDFDLSDDDKMLSLLETCVWAHNSGKGHLRFKVLQSAGSGDFNAARTYALEEIKALIADLPRHPYGDDAGEFIEFEDMVVHAETVPHESESNAFMIFTPFCEPWSQTENPDELTHMFDNYDFVFNGEGADSDFEIRDGESTENMISVLNDIVLMNATLAEKVRMIVVYAKSEEEDAEIFVYDEEGTPIVQASEHEILTGYVLLHFNPKGQNCEYNDGASNLRSGYSIYRDTLEIEFDPKQASKILAVAERLNPNLHRLQAAKRVEKFLEQAGASPSVLDSLQNFMRRLSPLPSTAKIREKAQ